MGPICLCTECSNQQVEEPLCKAPTSSSFPPSNTSLQNLNLSSGCLSWLPCCSFASSCDQCLLFPREMLLVEIEQSYEMTFNSILKANAKKPSVLLCDKSKWMKNKKSIFSYMYSHCFQLSKCFVVIQKAHRCMPLGSFPTHISFS